MPLQEFQPQTIRCAFCGATAIYDTDNERLAQDWDIVNVQDPCDPGCHVPERVMREHDSIVKSVLHPHFKRLFGDMAITQPIFKKGI